MKKPINIPYYKLLLIFMMGAITVSCSKDDDAEVINDAVPGVASLVLPENNTECEVGDVIANMAEVAFEWSEASDAERYDLVITNLATQEVTQRPNLNTTSIIVRLERGNPYTWKVISKNDGEETTASEPYRFYVAGVPGSNNVPFPATLISPASGVMVSPVDGKVTLEWEAASTDTDGDPLTYTLYADTVDGDQDPPEEWTGLTETSIEIEVEPNSIYYWHVETTDGKNTAISNTFSFRTGENTSSIQGEVVSTSQEILDAIAAAMPGENIYIRGGEYAFDSTIKINTSGSASNMISLLAHPEDDSRPKFDFSSMSENSSNRGIELEASYWHIKGIDVYKAGDNGLNITGNNNFIEFCTFSECADTGLQLDSGASNNTILNCDSYFNADSTIENADGFASKLDVGTGNKFVGCRAWRNLDDGWDGYLRNADNVTTIYENCWAIENGYLKDGTPSGGDGNGFKTGGSDNKDLKHDAIYLNCLAVGNASDGFDHNSNRGNVTLYNCSAYDNGRNYAFGNTNPLEKLTIKNSNVLGEVGSINATTLDVTNNSWMDGIETTFEDFESIDYEELTGPRKEDGSLPDVSFFHLTPGSDLIDKGVDVGLPFNGSAPDLGAFEY
ncbi:right-handed parallel beta-helix repeat-containing protein [Salegentibacter sp. JZCK2]|uniref:right-handed parallel beta-helix repeat-containing protein n=1 Tax=Salegentibacter tibetensis TaxID=2873600 RepID=UPI001CC92C4D|nr:right-handed parallel beta-helix repeat-containing protein [Salegentibacter tibetensis]MBZ9730106.1 right-handed parallel beta-helix repeat-containing protein [Salegentibacter tibetensis]